jgi:hypothetical protein
MIRRRLTWHSILGILAAVVDGVVAVFGVVGAAAAVVGVVAVVVDAVGAGQQGRALAITVIGAVVVAAVVGVGVAGVAAQIRGRRIRRTQSSGASGGLGLRVSRGGNMQHLLHACTSLDRLVDYLLDRAVDKLPAADSDRFAEEWRDHRQHFSGWRLVWWALCVRATAMHTVTALGPARLPRDS